MEYILVISITLAGVVYQFTLENTLWEQQKCDEMAEELQMGFTPVGTMTMEAYCEPEIGGRISVEEGVAPREGQAETTWNMDGEEEVAG